MTSCSGKEEEGKSGSSQKCANGRRRKMQISMLKVDNQELVDPQCLKGHVTNYYKQLFGSAEVEDMLLDLELWPGDLKSNTLIMSFSLDLLL
jgi:hypothetical protein